MTFGRVNFHDLFPEFDQLPVAPDEIYNPGGVVKRVELPDGKSYKFQYTPYKEIARVELPTGGAIEYDFPMPAQSGSGGTSATVYRPVLKRREYADGGSSFGNNPYSNEETFNRETTGTLPNFQTKVTSTISTLLADGQTYESKL